MNKYQLDKCREWVKNYCPSRDTVFPTEYVVQKLYEFVMPYRRNVQSLKKQMRYQKGAYRKLKAQENL